MTIDDLTMDEEDVLVDLYSSFDHVAWHHFAYRASRPDSTYLGFMDRLGVLDVRWEHPPGGVTTMPTTKGRALVDTIRARRALLT